MLIGRTDAEAPIFWPPDVKSKLTGKDPDAVKNLSAMQEIWVPSLGWEDPLEKGKATHSVF